MIDAVDILNARIVDLEAERDKLQIDYDELWDEAKRYREALEEIAKNPFDGDNVECITMQALETKVE